MTSHASALTSFGHTFFTCRGFLLIALESSPAAISAAMDVIKIVAILSVLPLCFTDDATLNFTLIVSFGQDGFNSSAGIPAIDLALEHIKSQKILGRYSLNYTTVRDSEVLS